MNYDMKLYYDYTVSPLGTLFYQTIWDQLSDIKEKNILDFGSGFGFTSAFLSKKNTVTALELDSTMIEACEKNASYTQLQGDLSKLHQFSDETFDMVTCHLVLEFVPDPKEILHELMRVLKKDGLLSIVRHNKNGRIIQAILQDYDLNDANNLLDGGNSFSSAFGDIKYYTNEDLLSWLDNQMRVCDIYGARVLGSLHSEEMQAKPNWVEEMFSVESRLLKNTDFVKIAYFNHILLQKEHFPLSKL